MISGEMEKSRGSLSRNYFFIKVEDYVKVYNRDASREMSPENVQTKIMVYEDRVNTWFLDILDEIKDTPDAGFLVLQSLVLLLDNNKKLTGNGGFGVTVKRLFGVDTDSNFAGNIISGMPKGVRFDLHGKQAIKNTDGTMVINIEKFLISIRKDMDRVFDELRRSAKMRATFNKNFKLF